MPTEKSCGAVVFSAFPPVQYLLLHYEAGHWDFVKGHVEKGEAELETVKRETQEETGLYDLGFVEGFRERIHYYYRRGGKTVYKEVIFYIVEARSGDVRISGEHIGFAWFDYAQAMRRLTYKNARNILRKANAFLEKLQLEAKTIQPA